MLVELGRVEIPGYADALRRESEQRLAAFVDVPGGLVPLCGLPVRILTLRLLHTLRAARNGFVCPWRFDTDAEVAAHALDFTWKISPHYRPPLMARSLDLGYLWHRARWQHRAARVPLADLIAGVHAYLADVFADSPFRHGGADATADNGQPSTRRSQSMNFSPALACESAYVIDLFAEGGYPWNADAILDCPLPRLWQHIRLIQQRVHGVRPLSEAQKLANTYMAHRRN